MTSGPKRFIKFFVTGSMWWSPFETALRQFKLEFDAGTTRGEGWVVPIVRVEPGESDHHKSDAGAVVLRSTWPILPHILNDKNAAGISGEP